MSAEKKPITVYGQGSPKAVQIAIFLAELSLPYEFEQSAMADQKSGIHDPNTNITLLQPAAILEYIVSNYNKDHRIIFRRGTPEFWHAKDWLAFETTIHAPVCEQFQKFNSLHSERSSTVVQHYAAELKSVTSTLEDRLSKQKEQHPGEGPWLVGDKLSFVDLSFLAWQQSVSLAAKDDYDVAAYPLVKGWLEKLYSQASVKEVLKLS